jgi:hypothetical protein
MTRFARNRDYYAGALMALIGAGAIVEGWSYGIGGLSSMGSGFFPVMLGIGLVILGAAMALMHSSAPAGHATGAPDWRGAVAIIAAVLLFIMMADGVGLAPAIFACVFVAALGTRGTSLREAALLALAVSVFGVLLFSVGLKVPFPILRGVIY